MKKFKKTYGIYIAFTLLSVVIYACCGDTNYRIVGSGYISAFDLETCNSLTDNSTGRITGPFSITVSHETTASGTFIDFNLIPPAHATSCPETFVNDLDENSLKISSNKPFAFKGSTVEPGTNLITTDGLDVDISWATIFFDFNASFIDNVEFSQELYEFTIEVNTTDGIRLQNAIELKFEIE